MKKSLTLLLIFVFQGLFAQQNGLSPEDVANIKQVSNAVISSDGTHIAYQLLVPANPKEENVPASTQLYVYNTKNKTNTPYITGYSVSNLQWRPGHNSISFTTKKENDKTTALYEISLQGGEAQKVYEFEGNISSYNWQPNGNKLAFVSAIKQEEDNTLPYQPEIYETNLQQASGYIVDLTNKNAKKLEVEGHVTSVQWSPEASNLMVSAAPSSLVDDFYTSQKIYFVDANTLKITGQVEHKGKLGAIAWSPNGERIAFIAGEDKHDPIDGRIFIAETSGGSPQMLQEDFEGQFHSLSWKDNKNLTLLGSEGVNSSLFNLNISNKIDKVFTSPNLNITGFSATTNKHIAFTANAAEHPRELFVLNTKNSSINKITDSNPWLKDRKLGKQEVITYKAKDGLELQGILIHPLEKSGKTPLITVVHGGPEAHYDNGWLTAYSMPGQVGAANGYAVFYPNYRGSTGRGAEFAKSSQGDPAGKEFDDIIDGIDYLIENYNIDENKVGVTGGSYGGYATAWMSTRHTKRFAAGVMSVGISNNISKWGTSDIPEEMFLVHSRQRIWEDYQFYLERSPIFYADQGETPLLILHGKEDTRVDPGQSFELYRHLKTRTETPVRLVLYPGEGHGNRKATARYDFMLRMMRWFDSYLKEGISEIPATQLELQEK